MKITKRDSIFLIIVAAVIIVLAVGSKERTTKAVPENETHAQVTSRAQCLACHDANGVKPQPLGHPKANQCFQCHKQPSNWKGQAK